MRSPDTIETPWFLEWMGWGPLDALPLWLQAGVWSAGVALLIFVVPAVVRWVWHLGDNKEREEFLDG